MTVQEQLQTISKALKARPGDTKVYWDALAERYATIMQKVQRLSATGNFLNLDRELQTDIEALIEKCRSAEFQIAAVGVLKAGKSMLMNALIGEELASIGLNSETAALAKFRASSKGHYVAVKFYTKEEWGKLNDSAEKNAFVQANEKKPPARRQKPPIKARDGEEESLRSRLAGPQIQEAAQKWIGHEQITVACDSLDSLKEEIQHWTSARSDDHLFASEVEVGIDNKVFHMPAEVVLVDTPGLQDPVEYRSNITMAYIKRANAVLIAVPPNALTV